MNKLPRSASPRLAKISTLSAATALLTSALATAEPVMQVRSVFAPGSGSNYLTEGVLPLGSHSQVTMYDALPKGLTSLSEKTLDNYFKPASFEIAPNNIASEITLKPGLRIARDKTHNIPHIFAETRDDAMFAVGYVRAADRLWQMELFRAQWRAESAVFLGRGDNDANIKADAQTFRLIDYSEAEYQAMFDNLRHGYGYWGRQAAADLSHYIDGFNAYIDATESHPALLPVEYVKRGIKPKRWRVSDAIAMAAFSHIAWGSAGLGEEANAQLLRQLEKKFGAKGKEIYQDLRQNTHANTPTSFAPLKTIAHEVNPASIALLDLDSLIEVPSHQLMLPKVRSNALLVAARHSTTGHPIAVQGPQDGYQTPHLFDSEIVISAPDFKARGILEVSGPYPYVAARSESYAWSITILPPDQADTFAELLCEEDGSPASPQSMHYLYKGKCLPFKTRIDKKQLANGDSYTLSSVRSVHGPVFARATVAGKPVALAQARAMYMHEEMDFAAHAQLFSPSVVRSAADFIQIVAGTAYNIGWWYIDDKDIAGVDAGLVPLRANGATTDLPVWGTGEWDWQGFDPDSYSFRSPLKSQYPQAINGEAGVIAGWNNPSALGHPLKDEEWSFGSDNRQQLLKDPTLAAVKKGPISITDLVKIHTNAAVTDFHARRIYPVLRQFIGSVKHAQLENILRDVDAWAKSGGLRLDSNGDNRLEHGKAIVFLDSLWPALVKAVFEPVLGADILAQTGISNNLPSLQPQPDNANGWISKIADEVRGYLGQARQPLSRNYCGNNTAQCRQLIIATLEQTLAAVEQQHGPDSNKWQVPASCTEHCLQIEFPATGDLPAVAPIAWQNRGTYIQATTFK